MVSIKHLFLISILVLFCLAEIAPADETNGDNAVEQQTTDVNPDDVRSDEQLFIEADAEQIASDGNN